MAPSDLIAMSLVHMVLLDVTYILIPFYTSKNEQEDLF